MKKSDLPTPVIKTEPAKTIIGLSIQTSLAENKTMELWQAFGPRRKEIQHTADGGSYSIQVYRDNFLTTPFLPTTSFTKWAGVAVTSKASIPKGLEVLEIPAGKWAVFIYQGTTRDFGLFAKQIYGSWLPASAYQIDERPHFEYMSEDYLGPNNPASEEEVWIPIK